MAGIEDKINKIILKRLGKIGLSFSSLDKSLQSELSILFSKFSEGGMISFEELTKYGRIDKFENKVISLVSKNVKQADKEIIKAVEESYTSAFESGYQELIRGTTFEARKVPSLPPQHVKQVVQNPLTGLTLNERLELNRVNIISKVNETLTKGLYTGDSYRDMALELSNVLEGNYIKATRIVRTEGHRVQETGLFEGAKEIEEKGFYVVKWWEAAKDDRVRDHHTELAEKYDYDHPIPMDEDFVSSIGGSGPYPGALGEAADDINCRCRMRSRIISPEEYEARFGTKVFKEKPGGGDGKKEEEEKEEDLQMGLEDLPAHELEHKGYYLENTQPSKIQYNDLYKISEENDGIDAHEARVSYIGAGHSQMNRYLRQGEEHLKEIGYTDTMIKEFKKNCDNLIASIENQKPVDAGLTFYRGLGTKSGKDLLSLADGEPYRDNGFQSFSILSSVSSNFTKDTGLTSKIQRVIIRGITNGNQKGIAGHSGEHEIIFAPGTEWQVVGREMIKGAKENHPDYVLVTVIGL